MNSPEMHPTMSEQPGFEAGKNEKENATLIAENANIIVAAVNEWMSDQSHVNKPGTPAASFLLDKNGRIYSSEVGGSTPLQRMDEMVGMRFSLSIKEGRPAVSGPITFYPDLGGRATPMMRDAAEATLEKCTELLNQSDGDANKSAESTEIN